MKYVFEVKPIEKDSSSLVDTMVAAGWEMYKIHEAGLVFRRSVPENYIGVWIVVERGNKDGKQIEVKHGPYHSFEDAENIIEGSTFVRIDKLWIPPEDEGGDRMDRVARFAVAEPGDPGTVCMDDVQPPRKKKKKTPADPSPRVNLSMADLLRETDRVRDALREDLSPGLIIDNMGPGPAVPVAPPHTHIAPRHRPATRSPAPRVGSNRHGSARPQQQQVRANVLDSIRNFGKKPELPKVIELGPSLCVDDPTDDEINEMAKQNLRILQSMRREHNQ